MRPRLSSVTYTSGMWSVVELQELCISTESNKHTGQLYGIGMDHPNRVDNPTEAQQQAQARFRDTWKEVDSQLADPTQRAEYERLFRKHITESRKRKKQPCASLRTFVFRMLYPKKG